MLIEFKVTNFLSIKDEQRLSMVASADKTHGESLIDPNLPGIKGLKFVKCAAIYGANASGKSNLIEALNFVKEFVSTSATDLKPGDAISAIPFLFDQLSTDEPSKFEVTFASRGVRYIFGFSVNQFRVIEEYLVAFPKGLPQTWYHRQYVGQEYKWSGSESALKKATSLREKTRQNALFLSVGPQFNNNQLTEVFNWFTRNLKIVRMSGDRKLSPGYSLDKLGDPKFKDQILKIIRNADIGIVDAEIVEKKFHIDEIRDQIPPAMLSQLSKEEINSKSVKFHHHTGDQSSFALEFESESEGTKKLFALAGPWTDILNSEHTVIIDELETSLHPLLVEELLKLLLDPKHCPGAAQVIFSTHSPLLLSANILRRDQIWFTEKNSEGATHLYPLTDFKPRNDESLAKGYLSGRYGAIPFIPAGLRQ